MENLKITFSFATPFFLRRFTTIDSILLALHYGSEPLTDISPYDDESVDFFEKKNGVLSGSIWFVENNETVIPYTDTLKRGLTTDFFAVLSQGVDPHEYGKSAVKQGSGVYKTIINYYERTLAGSIYFYIRGDADKISRLLDKVKYIGKKGKYGWGRVSEMKIEEIPQNKGFMLNKYTPSKPLSVSEWGSTVQTDRIAYFRAVPPYWLKTGLQPCYMPHTTLTELMDKKPVKAQKIIPDRFIAPSEIISSNAELPKGQKKYIKKVSGRCAFCGRHVDEGVPLSGKGLENVTSGSFADLNELIKDSQLVCNDCHTSIKALSTIFKSGMLKVIRQGSYETLDKEEFKEKILNGLGKPPYLITWKTSRNNQHIFYKGGCKVTLSSAMPVICRGDAETIYLDTEVFKQALSDAKELENMYIKLTKGKEQFPKTLVTSKIVGGAVGMPQIKKETAKSEEYMKKLYAFWRKYDLSTRLALHFFFEGKKA